MYYADLTPYAYDKESPSALNVGWLEKEYPYNQGFVSEQFLDGLFFLCGLSIHHTRGAYACPFCPLENYRGALKVFRKGKYLWLGSAEIKVESQQGKVYLSPNLIFHYVSEHNYEPPKEFIEAVCSIEKSKISKLKLWLRYYKRVFFDIKSLS